MSHTTAWTCRSCRAVLGQVRDGVLWSVVPVESVDGRGVARVPCPGCGRVRVWEPAPGLAVDPPTEPEGTRLSEWPTRQSVEARGDAAAFTHPAGWPRTREPPRSRPG